MNLKFRQQKRERRKKRVRAKISGDQNRLRLSVFRSNKHLFVQIINDRKGETIVSASSYELKNEKLKGLEKAKKVGELIAKRAKEKGIEKIVFDRSWYKFHGRVKALAEAARKAGLKF